MRREALYSPMDGSQYFPFFSELVPWAVNSQEVLSALSPLVDVTGRQRELDLDDALALHGRPEEIGVEYYPFINCFSSYKE